MAPNNVRDGTLRPPLPIQQSVPSLFRSVTCRIPTRTAPHRIGISIAMWLASTVGESRKCMKVFFKTILLTRNFWKPYETISVKFAYAISDILSRVTNFVSIQGVGGIPGVCPSTWIQWGGNCYKSTGQALNWTQSKEECVQMGGIMVVPQSERETQFLLQFMPAEAGAWGAWIWIDCNDIQVQG